VPSCTHAECKTRVHDTVVYTIAPTTEAVTARGINTTSRAGSPAIPEPRSQPAPPSHGCGQSRLGLRGAVCCTPTPTCTEGADTHTRAFADNTNLHNNTRRACRGHCWSEELQTLHTTPNCNSTKSWRVCMTVPAFVMPSYPPQVPQARRRTFQTRPGHGALPPGPLSPCPLAALAPLGSTQRACLGHIQEKKGWMGARKAGA
jgi:hypothetical protein